MHIYFDLINVASLSKFIPWKALVSNNRLLIDFWRVSSVNPFTDLGLQGLRDQSRERGEMPAVRA